MCNQWCHLHTRADGILISALQILCINVLQSSQGSTSPVAVLQTASVLPGSSQHPACQLTCVLRSTLSYAKQSALKELCCASLLTELEACVEAAIVSGISGAPARRGSLRLGLLDDHIAPSTPYSSLPDCATCSWWNSRNQQGGNSAVPARSQILLSLEVLLIANTAAARMLQQPINGTFAELFPCGTIAPGSLRCI